MVEALDRNSGRSTAGDYFARPVSLLAVSMQQDLSPKHTKHTKGIG